MCMRNYNGFPVNLVFGTAIKKYFWKNIKKIYFIFCFKLTYSSKHASVFFVVANANTNLEPINFKKKKQSNLFWDSF